MSLPVKAPNRATVGRLRVKKNKKRFSVKYTRKKPFDYNKYIRMEYWNKTQSRKENRRCNTIQKLNDWTTLKSNKLHLQTKTQRHNIGDTTTN